MLLRGVWTLRLVTVCLLCLVRLVVAVWWVLMIVSLVLLC